MTRCFVCAKINWSCFRSPFQFTNTRMHCKEEVFTSGGEMGKTGKTLPHAWNVWKGCCSRRQTVSTVQLMLCTGAVYRHAKAVWLVENPAVERFNPSLPVYHARPLWSADSRQCTVFSNCTRPRFVSPPNNFQMQMGAEYNSLCGV